MPKGKDRLAEDGYYVTYVDDLTSFGVVHIHEGKCKYIHGDWGTQWTTLTWTCAPTKKKVQAALLAKPGDFVERYVYFETHKDLLTYPHIQNKPGALVPSPLEST